MSKRNLLFAGNIILDPAEYMIVVPIVFNTGSRSFMTSHFRRILDDHRRLIAINPKFTKLITALKGAQFDDIGRLDKDESPHDNILDTFLMMTTLSLNQREMNDNYEI